MKHWVIVSAFLPSFCFANANTAMDLYLNQKYQQAFTEFEKTARLGDGRSQFNMAMQYLRGQGVKADPIMAYAYFTLAMDNQYKGAHQARKSVTKRLSNEQLQQARNKARGLIVKYGQFGSETLNYSLSRSWAYNPTPRRTKNPKTLYPSDINPDGLPGIVTYQFDIDANGMARDLILLESYPAKAFATSIEEKLQQSTYQKNKQGLAFQNATLSGFFKGSDNPEIKSAFATKRKSLMRKARRGDVEAQAELAQLLQLMHYDLSAVYVDAKELRVAKGTPRIASTSIEQPRFTPSKKLKDKYYNFNYLVQVDRQGKVIDSQPYQHVNIPRALTSNAERVLKTWQLKPREGERFKGKHWYMARFNYNNAPKVEQFSNNPPRAYVNVKPILNRAQTQQWRYWQLQAAKGGHGETLFKLGALCNEKLLTLAAQEQHPNAQVVLGKCLLNNAKQNKTRIANGLEWLNKAALKGNFIAMREIAKWYVAHSSDVSELKKAISLAKKVVDENDHPEAYAYIAKAYAKLGYFEEAIDYQEQAIDEAREQNYAVAPFERALAAYQDGQYIH